MLALWIGIAAHSMERKFCHGERHGFVEVHVLNIAIRIKEIITLPMGRQWRQRCIAELRIDLVTASEDDILVIPLAQKRGCRPVTRITPPLPLEGPRRADLPIVVGEIAWSFTIHLLRVSAKRDVGGSEREFGFVYRRRRVRTIVNENLIPVDLQVGSDADTPDMRRQLVR